MASIILARELTNICQLWGKIQDIALDPVKNTIYYFLPFLGVMSSKYIPITAKDPARNLMTNSVKECILNEIHQLGQCASLSRQFTLYTTLNQSPMNYGGSLSITQPALVLPYEMLIRPNASSFGSEKTEENLKENIHLFSDDETRFIIAHELSHLKFKESLVKTAVKLLLVASATFLFTSLLGWTWTAATIASAIMIYLIGNRYYASKMDLLAVKIVGCSIHNNDRAASAAVNVLKKIMIQNREKRESGYFYRLFITKSGNDFLDIKHPFVTSRIRNLDEKYVRSRINERTSRIDITLERTLSRF